MNKIGETFRKWNRGIAQQNDPKTKAVVVMEGPYAEMERRPERLGQPLQYTEEMNFLDQRRVCSSRLIRTMDQSRFYWFHVPWMRRQVREGWEREVRIVMSCLQKTSDDVKLYNEMQTRFNLAMRKRGTKNKVMALIDVFYWGLDQIEACLKRQPEIEEFDLEEEDITGRYHELRERRPKEEG